MALKVEIQELRSALNRANERLDTIASKEDSPANATTTNSNVRNTGAREWSAKGRRPARRRTNRSAQEVTQLQRGKREEGTNPQMVTSQAQDTNAVSSDSVNHGNGRGNRAHGSKVKVVGKRAIWGVIKSASSFAVKHAVCTLTSVSSDDIAIKRKVKSVRSKECWWFIITGQESILVKLDQEWSQVAIQTKWKLQNCFAPETESLQSQPQPAQIPQTDVSAQQTPCENSSDNLAGYASTTHPPALKVTGDSSPTHGHFP